jgi:enoyl-CoA hydratase
LTTPEVLFASEGSVAVLTFNRPQARNAMTWAMYDELASACDRVDGDAAIRVLVLRAKGRAFVSGTDIRQFTAFAAGEDGLAYERRIDAVIDRLERVAIPTIAQVEGPATGAGLMIALACDLRVCTPAAKFGIPIARTLGNCLSAANYARLMDVIGPARSKDLMFTGRLMDATEAEPLGLITRLAEPQEIDAAVRKLAQTISANAPQTIRGTKEAIRRIAAHRRLDASATDDLVVSCYASADFREGVEAFLAKRPPRFTGQ